MPNGDFRDETRSKEGLEAVDIDSCDDTVSCLQHGSTDIDMIRQIRALEQAKQADRNTLEKQISIITQQTATIAQKTATNAQLEEQLATMEVALNAKERELFKLQG